MEDKHYGDLQHIKSMMEQSTRFLSLSGWSGILAGTYAIIGALVAHYLLSHTAENHYSGIEHALPTTVLNIQLILVAAVVVFASVLTGFLLSYYKSKKKGVQFWTSATQRMTVHLLIPLVSGGIFCLALIYHHYSGLIAPTMLIFYGLALINASKFTLNEFHYLGICEVILGVFSLFFIGKGLYFWTFGFGVLHIIYGIVMERKYK